MFPNVILINIPPFIFLQQKPANFAFDDDDDFYPLEKKSELDEADEAVA